VETVVNMTQTCTCSECIESRQLPWPSLYVWGYWASTNYACERCYITESDCGRR